jgi:predicted transcriptional regulator
MATPSQLRTEIESAFKKGVSKEEVDKLAQQIASKLGKKPAVVKALITRYMNKGMIKEQGGKYVWAGQ